MAPVLAPSRPAVWFVLTILTALNICPAYLDLVIQRQPCACSVPWILPVSSFLPIAFKGRQKYKARAGALAGMKAQAPKRASLM